MNGGLLKENAMTGEGTRPPKPAPYHHLPLQGGGEAAGHGLHRVYLVHVLFQAWLAF